MRRSALWLAAFAVAGWSCSSPVEDDKQLTAEKNVRTTVEARGEATSALLAKGGQLIADYGSYQLIDAPRDAVDPKAEGVQLRDDYGKIFLNVGALETQSELLQAGRKAPLSFSSKRLHLIQFRGPIQPQWYKALEATGARIVTFIPSNAYLVWGALPAVESVRQLAGGGEVAWDGEYLNDYKIHPDVFTAEVAAYQVQLVEDDEVNGETLAVAQALAHRQGGVDRSLGYVNLIVFTDRNSILGLAKQPDVVSIMPWVEPKKMDERQNMIISGNMSAAGPTPGDWFAWLASKGFSGAGQFDFLVDVTDSGVDNANPTAPNHFALYQGGNVANQSRLMYARLEGTPHTGGTIQGCDGHGNLNTHIVGGYSASTTAPHADAQGFRYGLGVAPWVKFGSSVIFDPNSFTSPDYEDMLSRQWRDGARINTNSWGAAVGGAYTADSQRYDALVRDAAPTGSAVPVAGNQEMMIVFSAGNSGSGANTIGSPGTAKNVLTSAASENVHPFGAADQCGIADNGADSAMDIIFFSSRGPTDDGRKKPDLSAPGTHVSGGVAQADGQRANPPANPAGQALSCFDASGVCAGPGSSNFWPLSQQWTTASSGTSHSAPAKAGAAALVRQWFLNGGRAAPSPAMSKAFLMNTGRYMTGVGANDNLYSNNQGMGLMDLGMAFDDAGRMVIDQSDLNLFVATGETRVFQGFIAEPSRPFRVTLAWTDAPGSTTGNSYRNNLDLTVEAGGQTYLGNVFTGGTSVTGGTADLANNVESVWLPAGVTGPFTVTVTATNINSDGVPNNATAIDQDFALVVYNACDTAPSPITDLSASVPGDNQIALSWTGVGADSYRIYRSFTAGGPYVRVGETTATSFVDATVSGGSTYHYVVRGVLCAEALDSNEVSATATGACMLPPEFAGIATADNGAVASCTTDLGWAAATPRCGGAISYNVYRSSTAGFTPSIGNRIASGVTGTTYADNAALVDRTTYYYVVRAVETAAEVVEENNTVELAATPTGALTGGVNYFDDLDGTRPPSAAAYWQPTYLAGTGTLTMSTCRWQSTTTAWRWGGTSATTCPSSYPASSQARLILGGNGGTPGINGFAIPALTLSPQMTFRHWFSMENGYDGVWLVYSTAGASGPWFQVMDTPSATAPYITAGGYTGTLRSNSAIRTWTNTTAGIGANGSLRTVNVNLEALAGQTVWFAWQTYSDSSVSGEGHYLDDVSITAPEAQVCSTNPVPPGPAVSFRITGLPDPIGAGVEAVTTVTAYDAWEQVASDHTGTATFSSTDPQAVLPPDTAFTAGVLSAAVTFGTTGLQAFTATDTVNAEVTGSASTTVTPGAPHHLVVSRQPSDAVAGVANAPAPLVRVEDVFNNLVTAATTPVTVALGQNPGAGTLSGTLTVTAVSGVATFGDLSIDKAAPGYTLTFAADGLTGTESALFAITPAAPAKLAVLTQPSSVAAGFAMAPAPQIAILDAFDNLTDAVLPVSLALENNPSGATLSGTTTELSGAGIATFPALFMDLVGAGYSMRATSGTLTDIVTGPFDVSHGTPYRVTIEQQPSNRVAGQVFSPAIAAAVRDRFGNLADTSSAAVHVSLLNASGAQLLGTGTRNAVAGIATFGDLAVDKAGTNYVLNVGSDDLHSALSTTFSVTVGAPAALSFVAQPSSVVAGAAMAPVTVAVVDAYGNLVDAAGTVTVALGNNPAGGTLSGTLSATAAGGLATFSDLNVNRAGVGYTLTAASGTLAAVGSDAFDVHAGPASTVEFSVNPSNATAGAAIAPAVRVLARDALGNVAAGFTGAVTLSLSANPGSATLSGDTVVNAVGGEAIFSGLSLNKAATGYVLRANAGTMSADSAAFNIVPAASARLVFTAQPASGTAGVALAPVVLQVQDAHGNLTPSFTGAIRLAVEGGTPLFGTTTVNAVSGQATFADLSIRQAGAGYALVAGSTGLPTTSSAAFDIATGPEAAMVYLAQPTDTQAGAALATVRLALVDAYGNLTASTSNVGIALGANPGGATLNGTTTVAAAGGVASFNDLTIEKAASGYTLTATSASAGSATSHTFNVTTGVPNALEFVTEPSNSVAGAAITPSVQVRVRDAFGNTVTGFAGNVSVALANNPSGAALLGDTTAAAIGGVARFIGLSVSKAGAGYTLAATSGSIPGDTSAAFNVSAGAAVMLHFGSQPSNVASRQALPDIVLHAMDAQGNVATGFTGTVSLSLQGGAGGAVLSGTTSRAATAGAVTFTGLSVDKAGTGYTLMAMADGMPSTASAAFNVSAGIASQYAMSGLPATVTAGVAVKFTVQALDEAGNLAADYAGVGAVTSSDATATLPGSPVSFVSGVASNIEVTFRRTGVQTVTVTDTNTATLTAQGRVLATAFPQPRVSLTAPATGAQVDGVVTITAEGAVADGTTLSSIELFIDGVAVHSATTSPATYEWDTKELENKSQHTITAVIKDAAGNEVSDSLMVQVVKQGCGCGATGPVEAFAWMGMLVGLRLFLRARRRP